MFISICCYSLNGLHVYWVCICRHVVCGWVEADQCRLKAKRPMASQIDCRSDGYTSQADGPENVPDALKARRGVPVMLKVL